MQDKPSRQQRILEAIETSGRGRHEASDTARNELAAILADRPDLAGLYERNKQLDEVLARVFGDVPVPEGLPERILSRLEEAHTQESDGPSVAAGPTDVTTPVRPAVSERDAVLSTGRCLSRRWWIAASAGAVAVSVLVVCVLCLRTSEEHTLAEVLDEAVGRFVRGELPPGEPVSRAALASVSREIRWPAGTQRRNVEDFLGCRAVAYEMSDWEGTRATLFVVPHGPRLAELGEKPPYGPSRATGGMAAGAWRVDDVLHILVVEGDQRAYRRFLEPGRPLT